MERARAVEEQQRRKREAELQRELELRQAEMLEQQQRTAARSQASTGGGSFHGRSQEDFLNELRQKGKQ